MAQYESFWVVVGTAAPVIALAHVVAVGSAVREGTPYGMRRVRWIGFGIAALGFACCGAATFDAMRALGDFGSESRLTDLIYVGVGIFLLLPEVVALAIASLLDQGEADRKAIRGEPDET